MVTTRPRLLWASLLAATLAIGAPRAVMAQPTDEEDEAGAPADEGNTGDADMAPPADTAAGDETATEEEEAEPTPPPPPPADESATVEGATTAADVTAAAEDNAEATEEEGAIQGPGEVIVVTGSVIARQATTTPAPVAVIDRLDLDASGMVSVGEILQNLPAQSNAINVNVNNGGDGATRINLRGLGSNRTLVLFNGRRLAPSGTGADSSADLGNIPVAIIERIEVLKDGASAIYGSDAIGGVVNIITRQDYAGSDVNLYTGTTQHGGGTVYDVSMVTGLSSKRGSVLVSASYYEQKDIFSGDRDWAKTAFYYDFAGDPTDQANYPSNDGTDCIHDYKVGVPSSCYPYGSTTTPGGTIVDYGEDPGNQTWQDLANAHPGTVYWYRNPDTGTWGPMNTDGNSDDGSGDLYNYTPANYLLTPAKRYNVYTQGRWTITDNADAYISGTYTNRKSSQELAPEPLTPGYYGDAGITVAPDNYYNPFGRMFWDMRRRMVEGGPRHFEQNLDTFQLVIGLDGKFPEALKGWRWDINYNYGSSGGLTTEEGHYIVDRLEKALGPSYQDPDTGEILCGTPGNPIDGCVPLNLFGGPGTITEDMLDYLRFTSISKGYNTMSMAQASANGLLFTTPWNGDVRLALGAEYRKLSGGFLPDAMVASGNASTNAAQPTDGSYDVTEGYAELSAVPITNKPGIKWLELSAAIRGFNYNTFGSDFTWKSGVLWKMPMGLSVRGTYSTAFRAPSILDLYRGASESFPSVTDPCDTLNNTRTAEEQAECSAQGIPDDYVDANSQQKEILGGNPDVNPETANIFTGGIVYEPPAVKGLAVTLDYFWIHVDNAITPWGAGTILQACYTSHDPYACSLVIRDSDTHKILYIDDRNTNIGGDKTAGLDFQVQYTWNHPTAGRFRHNLEGTFEQKFNSYIPDPSTDSGLRVYEGTGTYDLGTHPRWKFNFNTLWGLNDMGAGFNVRYIGGFKECEDNDCDTFDQYSQDELTAMGYPNGASRTIDRNITADLFVNYSLKYADKGRSMLTLGVNNLTDQDPPFIANSFLNTADTDYDFMGRYFYVRFAQSY